MEKLFPLARWYCIGSALVVTGTAFLTWCSDSVSGQNDLLMLFLGGILMLTFLFCIPLAIMNYVTKDYFFTAAVSILSFFMVRAHFTVMDTLGVNNIQMQACIVFLGVCLGAVVVAYIRIINPKVVLDKKNINSIIENSKCIIADIFANYVLFIPYTIMTIFIIAIIYFVIQIHPK